LINAPARFFSASAALEGIFRHEPCSREANVIRGGKMCDFPTQVTFFSAKPFGPTDSIRLARKGSAAEKDVTFPTCVTFSSAKPFGQVCCALFSRLGCARVHAPPPVPFASRERGPWRKTM
jgi:hypothetical protein